MTLDNLIDYTLDNLIGVDKNASFLFFIKVTSILLKFCQIQLQESLKFTKTNARRKKSCKNII